MVGKGTSRHSAVMVCVHLQILIGGGQDAADVTTTNDRAGGFQSRFFHKVNPPSLLPCIYLQKPLQGLLTASTCYL